MKEEGIEYSIYVHHHPESEEDTGRVELIEKSQNMDQMIDKAEIMSTTGQYHKVEVKKKFQDPENDRTIEMTLKLYEGEIRMPVSLSEILLVVVMCGTLAFLSTYFGSKYYDLYQLRKLEERVAAQREKLGFTTPADENIQMQETEEGKIEGDSPSENSDAAHNEKEAMSDGKDDEKEKAMQKEKKHK